MTTLLRKPLGRRALAAGALGVGLATTPLGRGARAQAKKQIVYLTPGLDLPFWRILAKGIADEATRKGAVAITYDSHNNAQTQLQNAQDATARQVAGIIISPTASSTAPAALAAAARAGIPVVIADIGTTGGEYVSFIISDNEQGAYGIGQVLGKALKAKGWNTGSYGMVTISLARNNGKLRTAGFRRAMQEAGVKEAALSQMQTYTADETFRFVQDMLTAHPDMRGLFIETDQPTIGALRALQATRRQGSVLVASFDGIPDFVKMIGDGTIVGSGMQQPYLMGQRSAQAMFDHFAKATVLKQIVVPIEVVTAQNIQQLLPTIKTTVFGNEMT
uniref:Ribose ABC transporter substrate-binding protein n=1 Tax=Acidicaldus sp. TaxID=1872105 RepID=A0A8J4HA99_9PROT